MIPQSLLQPIDINVDGSSSSSPSPKRAKYDTGARASPCEFTGDKSLSSYSDEHGVGRIDYDSDYAPSDDDTIFKKGNSNLVNGSCPSMTPDSKEKQAAVIESVLSKETVQKLSVGEWDDFLIRNQNSEESHKIDYFEKLPDEVVLNILRWLPKRDLLNLSHTCKRLYTLSEDDTLWTRLDVSNTTIVPGGIGTILGRQVVILRMAKCDIKSPIIMPETKAFFPNFQCRLLYLDLSMAYISPESLVEIFTRCIRLKKLSLEHVPVNDEVLIALSYCKHLEVVNFAMSEGIQLIGLQSFLTSCRKIRELNLAWTSLKENTITFICKNAPNTVNRLNISGCRKLINDKNIADLVKCCPDLTELDLSDCTSITGESIKSILLLERLNFLALSRCYYINWRDIMQLKNAKSLQFLDVHGGYLLPNEIKDIQTALPNVALNKYKFSSVARPTVGPRRSSIWNLRVRD